MRGEEGVIKGGRKEDTSFSFRCIKFELLKYSGEHLLQANGKADLELRRKAWTRHVDM